MGIVSKNLKQRDPTQVLKQAKKKNRLTESHNPGHKFMFPVNHNSKAETGFEYVFGRQNFYFFVFKFRVLIVYRIKQRFKINIRDQICKKFGIKNPNNISRIDPANLNIPHFTNFQPNVNLSIYGSPQQLRWQMRTKYRGTPRDTHMFDIVLSDANKKRLVILNNRIFSEPSTFFFLSDKNYSMLSLDVRKRNESNWVKKDIIAFHVSAVDSFRRFTKWGQYNRPDVPCGNDVCIHETLFAILSFNLFFFVFVNELSSTILDLVHVIILKWTYLMKVYKSGLHQLGLIQKLTMEKNFLFIQRSLTTQVKMVQGYVILQDMYLLLEFQRMFLIKCVFDYGFYFHVI